MFSLKLTSKAARIDLLKNIRRNLCTKADTETPKISISREIMPPLPYTAESAETIPKSSKVVLIRHGNSMFNKLFHELEGYEYIETPRYFDIYSDLGLIDSPLSPLGVEQCEQAAQLSNIIKFDTVFVSPLRRALQTAYIMFKNHPDFGKIKFIVHPQMRENIMTIGD